jgi:hypothetical protein
LGAGVTYVRSRDARREEAVEATPHDHDGESPLHLPQAKTYERSCSLGGPCIVPVEDVIAPFRIRMEISLEDRSGFAEETSTQRMKRGFDEPAAGSTTHRRIPSARCCSPGPAWSPGDVHAGSRRHRAHRRRGPRHAREPRGRGWEEARVIAVDVMGPEIPLTTRSDGP